MTFIAPLQFRHHIITKQSSHHHTIIQTQKLIINRQPTPLHNAFSCTPGAAVQPLWMPRISSLAVFLCSLSHPLRICQVCTIWRGYSLQQHTHKHTCTHAQSHTHTHTQAYMHTQTQTNTIQQHTLHCVPGVTMETDPYHSPPAPLLLIYTTAVFQNASIS